MKILVSRRREGRPDVLLVPGRSRGLPPVRLRPEAGADWKALVKAEVERIRRAPTPEPTSE